jgi:NAD(P)H-dependent flavin oxidoreductase YrpB (nitropropane dioxygenase family)
MLTTPLCRTLGMTVPIFSIGMGALAGPTLAAAVSNAGACGVLSHVSGAPAAHLRQQIRQVRELTDKAFGVNIVRLRPYVEEDMLTVNSAILALTSKVAMLCIARMLPRSLLLQIRFVGADWILPSTSSTAPTSVVCFVLLSSVSMKEDFS